MPSPSKAAAAFAQKWAGVGDEKQDSQRFWIELLQKVYGVEDPASFVRFEQRVQLSHVSYIDVMIPATHTMKKKESTSTAASSPRPSPSRPSTRRRASSSSPRVAASTGAAFRRPFSAPSSKAR